MDRKEYVNMLESKEDEWVGMLQKRRVQLEQEDITDEAIDCEKEREKIHELEERLAGLRARREELDESEEDRWEDLKKELERKVEEFRCDFDEIFYYEDNNTKPKQ